MNVISRCLAAVGLFAAVGIAGPATAATVPAFQGTIGYSAVIDGGIIDALASGDVADGSGALFELSIGGLFDLDPLGANPGLVFLNIFEPSFGPLALGSATLVSSLVETGPVATLLFLIEDGRLLSRVLPEARVVLSGLTGPTLDGFGEADIAVFLTPIPLPAAATLLLAGLAGLALAGHRRT